MGDNVFTTKDDKAKPDKASAAFLEAQKHLEETHLNLSAASAIDLGGSTTPGKSPFKAATDAKPATVPAPAEAHPDTSALHLTGLAFTSAAKGLWEPLAGGIQITEQVANAATLNMPGVHKAYFHPENLTPSTTEPAPQKYSKEWVVSNLFENVGKLPWYYLAGKGMSKVPGFKEEAGLMTESGMLGFNMKSAAASGFIVGGLTPTDVAQDTSLSASLKERGIQASIGAGQMALVSLGTTFAGKGVAIGEKALLGKTEAVTAEQTLARAAEIAPPSVVLKSAQAGLKFAKNGSIASIGAIPAGLIAGYANAKIHGTEFDPTENIAATMTVGFGLGALGGGNHSEAARSTAAGEAIVRSPADGLTPVAKTSESAPVRTESSEVTTSSPITAKARARMSELADRARAAFVGGTPEQSFAFNSNDGAGPENPLNKTPGKSDGTPKTEDVVYKTGENTDHTGDKPVEPVKLVETATPLEPAKPVDHVDPVVPVEPVKATAPAPEAAPEKVKAKRVDSTPESLTPPDAEPAATRKERTFQGKASTPEELAKYHAVFKSLMEASRAASTSEHEADFVKAAVAEPWTVAKLRADAAKQGIATEHVTGLLDRATKAVRDDAVATEKVPAYARPAFDKGYDLLRGVADAQKTKQLSDGLKALRSFIKDSDDVLAAKDQLRSAAEKMGGDKLVSEFDRSISGRYSIAYVHQLDNAASPGAKDQFVEVRSTQVEDFKAIRTQAKLVAEGSDPVITTASGKVIEPKSTLEQRYIHLRQISENLDPDLKASLIAYASKTNDVRFRALINDIVADPKGEDLPNRPIRIDHIPALEKAWDKIEETLAAHPKPAVAGEAPSAADVALYRENVFKTLTLTEQSDPGVINLAKQYARQTNNSFEASALDYYFGSSRLNAFDSVKQAKAESAGIAESRDKFKPGAPIVERLDLEAGEMQPGNGYLDRVIARLGDKYAPAVRSWNGSAPVENLLADAYQKFTDQGVTRGKFKDRADGLVKVISQPDNASGLLGGRHSTAYFEGHPNGTVQVDDFADGTRWIVEKPAGEPESSSAFFPDGTEYTIFNPKVWSIDFPNGNYIYSYPEGTSDIAREIRENGKTTQVLRDGTTRVIGDSTAADGSPEQNIATPGGAGTSVETLMETMRSAQNENGRIAAAEALKGQVGSMDDAQFKSWLEFIGATPPEANARPPYMKMAGMRGMHALFESGILEDPAAQKSFKNFLEVPPEGQFKLAYPKSMSAVTSDAMPPALANDIRERFSATAADGTKIYAPNVPAELRSYFENNKPYEIKDKWDNELPGLAKDNLAARLAAIPDLASFKPQTATRLLELGQEDPRALSEVMRLIKEPRNDLPAMRTLLAETIPNADDIYTVKVLLESIDGARRAYKTPALKETNRDLALTALANLTGDVAQDIRLGEKVDEIIKAPGGGKGSPDTSRMAANLELLPRTKVDPDAVTDIHTEIEDPALRNGEGGESAQHTEVVPGTPAPLEGKVTSDASTAVVEPGTENTAQPPVNPETTESAPAADKPLTEEVPVAQAEPVKPTVENLVEQMNSSQPDRVRLAAAESLKGQLSTMDDAQFHEWLQFVRQDSQDAPIRPNYMKMSGMRSLADLLNSDMLNDPAAAKALRDYMTPPAPGEFKLPYPEMLKTMDISKMPPALLNDIRDRFSMKGPDGLTFQADVPPAMQDYLNNNQRLRVTDNKGRRLPDLQADTLDTRVAVSSQLAQFKPETAARLLEIGAQDPRSLADVIRLMKEPRNDNPKMRNLLAETIPNADNVYELKMMLESIDAARWAYSPERAMERETNQNLALRALGQLTGDTAQDLRLGRDINDVIRSKAFIKDPKPSRLASDLTLAERTKPDSQAALEQLAGQQLTAQQIGAYSSVEPEITQLEPTHSEVTHEQPQQPELESSAPLRNSVAPEVHEDNSTVETTPANGEIPTPTSQPEAATVIPNQANTETSTGGGGDTGNSRIERFNRRQRQIQQPQQRPDATSGAPSRKSGRGGQTINSLADLGKLNFGTTTDSDDIAGSNKSHNASKHERKEESKRRDRAKSERDDDFDN